MCYILHMSNKNIVELNFWTNKNGCSYKCSVASVSGLHEVYHYILMYYRYWIHQTHTRITRGIRLKYGLNSCSLTWNFKMITTCLGIRWYTTKKKSVGTCINQIQWKNWDQCITRLVNIDTTAVSLLLKVLRTVATVTAVPLPI